MQQRETHGWPHARDEFLLAATQNLRKLAKLVPPAAPAIT